MGIKTRSLSLILVNLAFICLIFCSQLSVAEQISSEDTIYETIKVDDFSAFNLIADSEHITSENLIDEVKFDYLGTDTEHTNFDRYQYDLAVNCTDFYIRVKFNYTASDVGSNYIAYLQVFGEGIPITILEVYDAWISSEAKYYLQGYPDGIGDPYETAANSAGLSRIVIFEIFRFDNVLESRILSEDGLTTYLSHRWSSGVDTKVSRFNINLRAGLLGSTISCNYFDLHASFTSPDGFNTTDPDTTPTTITITTLPFGFSVGMSISIFTIFIGLLSIIRRKYKN